MEKNEKYRALKRRDFSIRITGILLIITFQKQMNQVKLKMIQKKTIKRLHNQIIKHIDTNKRSEQEFVDPLR